MKAHLGVSPQQHRNPLRWRRCWGKCDKDAGGSQPPEGQGPGATDRPARPGQAQRCGLRPPDLRPGERSVTPSLRPAPRGAVSHSVKQASPKLFKNKGSVASRAAAGRRGPAASPDLLAEFSAGWERAGGKTASLCSGRRWLCGPSEALSLQVPAAPGQQAENHPLPGLPPFGSRTPRKRHACLRLGPPGMTCTELGSNTSPSAALCLF